MKKNAFTVLVVTLILCSVAGADDPPEVVEFDYRAECTSKETGGDGRRHSCTSAWSTHLVPSGYVYVEDQLVTGTTSANGSSKRCDVQWGKEVEIVKGTGIMQPTELKIRAHARSPKGHWSGRGWAKSYFRGVYVRFQ